MCELWLYCLMSVRVKLVNASLRGGDWEAGESEGGEE